MSTSNIIPDRTVNGGASFNVGYVKFLAALGVTMSKEDATTLLSTPRAGRGKPKKDELLRRDAARLMLGLGPKADLVPDDAPKAKGPRRVRVRIPANAIPGAVMLLEVIPEEPVIHSAKVISETKSPAPTATVAAPAVELAETQDAADETEEDTNESGDATEEGSILDGLATSVEGEAAKDF